MGKNQNALCEFGVISSTCAARPGVMHDVKCAWPAKVYSAAMVRPIVLLMVLRDKSGCWD